MVLKVLTSLSFASERIKFAMHVGLFSILTNFLNYFLVRTYRVNGLAKYESCDDHQCCFIFLGNTTREENQADYGRWDAVFLWQELRVL